MPPAAVDRNRSVRLSRVGEFGRGSLARLHRRYPAPGEIRVCGTHKPTRVAVVHVRQGRPTKPLSVLAGMQPRHRTQWHPHSAGHGPGMRPRRGVVGDAEEQAAGFSPGRSSLRRQSRPIRATTSRYVFWEWANGRVPRPLYDHRRLTLILGVTSPLAVPVRCFCPPSRGGLS